MRNTITLGTLCYSPQSFISYSSKFLHLTSVVINLSSFGDEEKKGYHSRIKYKDKFIFGNIIDSSAYRRDVIYQSESVADQLG